MKNYSSRHSGYLPLFKGETERGSAPPRILRCSQNDVAKAMKDRDINAVLRTGSSPMTPLVLLVAAAGTLLVSAYLARLAELPSRVGARHAGARVRVFVDPVWSDHSLPLA